MAVVEKKPACTDVHGIPQHVLRTSRSNNIWSRLCSVYIYQQDNGNLQDVEGLEFHTALSRLAWFASICRVLANGSSVAV